MNNQFELMMRRLDRDAAVEATAAARSKPKTATVTRTKPKTEKPKIDGKNKGSKKPPTR